MTLNGKIWSPDLDDVIDDLPAALSAMAASMNNALPVKTATTLAQLNGMVGGIYTDGTLASIVTSTGGLARGVFVADESLWYLASGAKLDSLATFQASVSANAAIRTLPGATFYDVATSSAGMWVSESAGYKPISPFPMARGAGQYKQTVPVNGSGTVGGITFPAGRFSTPPTVLINTDSARLNVVATNVTKDGFSIVFNNWSTGGNYPLVNYAWFAVGD